MLENQLENLKIGDKLKANEYGENCLQYISEIKNTIFEVEDISKYFVGNSFKLKAIYNNVNVGYGVFSDGEVLGMFDVIENNKAEVVTDPDKLPTDVKKIIYNKDTTIVILHSGAKGISKPLLDDKYNKHIGFRVAYIKAKTKELNKELKKY